MLKHRALTESRWRHLLIVVLTLCVSVVPTVPTSAATSDMQMVQPQMQMLDDTVTSGTVQNAAQNAAPEQELAVIVSYHAGVEGKGGLIGEIGGMVSREFGSPIPEAD